MIRALVSPLLGRTLMRRVSLSLLLAFGLVYLLLIFFHVQRERIEDNSGKSLDALTAVLQRALEDAHTAGEARAATALLFNMMVDYQHANALPEPGRLQVWDRTQPGFVFASPGTAGERLPAAPARGAQVLLNGVPHRLWSGGTPRWAFRLAVSEVSNFWLWQRIGGALLGYMAVTLAATLLAIWWSVWHGLKPLQRLSAQIAARSDDDLSPLVQVPLHAELKPLAASIDHLLARLLRKVQREHAFVQDAAHELRTPMAVISAQAHVLARVGDAATRHEAEQHMDQAIARASHLVEQLLQLARVDREGLQPLRPIDIAQVARQVLADCAPAAMARGIELSLDAPDTLLHPFDLHAAESVLHNLLDNAIRYGHEGGRVAAELRRDGQALVLSVADDGPGIPPGERQRVFERFYRGSTGQCSTGSGLGLAIVQQAVGRMAGQVRLSSGLHERGCRFTATFPPVQEP